MKKRYALFVVTILTVLLMSPGCSASIPPEAIDSEVGEAVNEEIVSEELEIVTEEQSPVQKFASSFSTEHLDIYLPAGFYESGDDEVTYMLPNGDNLVVYFNEGVGAFSDVITSWNLDLTGYQQYYAESQETIDDSVHYESDDFDLELITTGPEAMEAIEHWTKKSVDKYEDLAILFWMASEDPGADIETTPIIRSIAKFSDEVSRDQFKDIISDMIRGTTLKR